MQHIFVKKREPLSKTINPQVSTPEVFAAIYGDYAVHDLLVAFFQQYELFLTPTIARSPNASGIFGRAEVAGSAVSLPLEPFIPHLFNPGVQLDASNPISFPDDGLPVNLQILDAASLRRPS
jgi:Asp-tRNA(Asn)/Glu-tRNA(Gln) amidotransferase A subunit family amidase